MTCIQSGFIGQGEGSQKLDQLQGGEASNIRLYRTPEEKVSNSVWVCQAGTAEDSGTVIQLHGSK